MRWLARFSPARAFAIAALWPATLLVVYVVLTRLLPLWVVRHSDVAVIYAEVEAGPGALPRLLAFVIVPPLGFLIAWGIARR